MSDYAREYTSRDRRTMRDKADRLASQKGPDKVDCSDFSPAEPLNDETKTGMQPVSRRAFKAGGKVEGHAHHNAGRKPRASGGRGLVDALVNANVKDANEERPGGKDHVGGYRRGGRTGKDGGGPLSGAISQGIGGQGRMSFNYPTARGPMQVAGGLKTGGAAKDDHWIAGATKNKGALHRELHVPEGEKIPAKKLEKAEHSKNPTERKRADLAKTLEGMHHKDGGRAARKDGGRAKGKMNVNIIIAQKPEAPAMPEGAPAGPPPPPPGAGGPGFVQQPPQRPPLAMAVPVGGMGGGAPAPAAPPPPMPRKRGGRTVED